MKTKSDRIVYDEIMITCSFKQLLILAHRELDFVTLTIENFTCQLKSILFFYNSSRDKVIDLTSLIYAF